MATTVSLKPNAVEISGSTSGTTTLQATAVAGTTTLTLPAATDTLVGKATTDTLTNKTLTGAVMNGTLGATTPSTVAATSISASTTLGVTGVATFSAGTAALPAITTTGDTNTGIFFPAADTIAFAEGGVESMRIDSSGNLGIGTSSPGVKLETSTARSATVTSAIFGQTGTGAVNDVNKITLKLQNTLGGSTGGSGIGAILEASASNKTGLGFYYDSGSGSQTEAARITSGGDLLVGTSSLLGVSNTGTTHIAGGGSSTNQPSLYLRNPSSTAGRYWKTGPTQDAGFIIYNDSDAGQYMSYGGTTWNSSSDERNKTDLIPISNAVAKVVTLRAVTGRYISDEEGTSRSFLIAQDVQAVLPEAVDVQNNEQGTLGLAYTAVVPLLVAAIKEQSALITQLTARITALEGA